MTIRQVTAAVPVVTSKPDLQKWNKARSGTRGRIRRGCCGSATGWPFAGMDEKFYLQ